MFQLNSISKRFGKEYALNDVSFQIGHGLNFLIGPSGSGKTTLLKILTGLDSDYEGDVSYFGKSMKTLSDPEKAYFYNHVFGFIWQDFNLLEDCTVLENILLPSCLTPTNHESAAKKNMNQLRITDISSQKVRLLSGGQKQRVALARELMKDPQVIIADEPTSALDRASAKTIMDLLRTLSKTKTVIIVTHDTSFIRSGDSVFELDKGELISSMDTEKEHPPHPCPSDLPHRLSFGKAYALSAMGIRQKPGRWLISVVSVILSSALFLAAVSGSISDHGQDEFQKLFDTYGDALTDIGIYSSFFNASDSKDDASQTQNKGAVDQNIGGLYERYDNDERVSFVTYLQAFNDINISYHDKSYKIQSSGTIPSINKLVIGHMPSGSQREVVVPETLVKQLGLTPEDALGKEIHFSGSVVNWKDGSPVYEKTEIQASICGVMDTTVNLEFEGEAFQVTVDDSFLFSKFALDEMLKQVGKDTASMNFLIRAKSPQDMIAIKDELNAQGIVPLGRFELIEDIVRLNQKTGEQSAIANIVMGILAFVILESTCLMTGYMHRKETAIYRISGFSTKHLFLLHITDSTLQMLMSILGMLTLAPIWRFVFPINLHTLSSGVGIIITLSLLACMTTAACFIHTDPTKVLKAGDRS